MATPAQDRLGDQPIEPALHDLMNALAKGIDDVLNGPAPPGEARRTGFILMVFPFDGHAGRCNYVANARRDDVVVLLREQLARFEGRAGPAGSA